MAFTRTRKGVRLRLDDVEAGVLARLLDELLALLDHDAPEVGDDPLQALVGLPTGEVRRSDDPVLRRLFPDAFLDDEAGATEFRRLTELDLRAGKRASARAVREAAVEGEALLDRAQCDAWLGTLNDLRLALGTRLGVTEDLDVDDLDDDDPRVAPLHVYGWLSWLQESLLRALR